MDKESEIPEKRFEDYQQVFNSQAVAIGFTLPGSDFLFKYDADGGWKDEKGNYYNSKGVLQKISDEHSEEDEEQVDEEEIEVFERMLDDVQQEKHKDKKQDKKKEGEKKQETYETETKSLLQKYKKKQNVREGLPQQLHIYFKMRTKFYHRIKPTVEKAQSTNEANEQIVKIKAQGLQQSQKLKNKLQWLVHAGQFQYSGTHLDEATYDRYWYGYLKANPENYEQILASVEKSQEFALLQHKTFYALKSKFYLKNKMKDTINTLRQSLKGKEDDDLIQIKISNLSQNFPCSLILDLLTYSGTSLDELFSVSIIDQQTAEVFLSKKGAQKFINVEGYTHDHKEFLELDLQVDKQARKLKSNGLFNVSVSTSKQNPYKTHTRELSDTLALMKNREELAKLYTKEQQAVNGGFRFVVGKNILKKLLMFRGSSLDVLKVQAFSK